MVSSMGSSRTVDADLAHTQAPYQSGSKIGGSDPLAQRFLPYLACGLGRGRREGAFAQALFSVARRVRCSLWVRPDD